MTITDVELQENAIDGLTDYLEQAYRVKAMQHPTGDISLIFHPERKDVQISTWPIPEGYEEVFVISPGLSLDAMRIKTKLELRRLPLF